MNRSDSGNRAQHLEQNSAIQSWKTQVQHVGKSERVRSRSFGFSEGQTVDDLPLREQLLRLPFIYSIIFITNF